MKKGTILLGLPLRSLERIFTLLHTDVTPKSIPSKRYIIARSYISSYPKNPSNLIPSL